MTTVRYYDPKTKTVTNVPVDELAPGCILCTIEGIEGTVFAEAADFKAATEYRHPPFTDPAVLAVFREFSTVFNDVRPLTPQEWEDGFRYDTHPDREIAWWQSLSRIYRIFIDGKKLSVDHKIDYYHLCFAFLNNGPEAALPTVSLRRLSKARARSVIASLKTATKS